MLLHLMSKRELCSDSSSLWLCGARYLVRKQMKPLRGAWRVAAVSTRACDRWCAAAWAQARPTRERIAARLVSLFCFCN
jgi:hypothetical protein